MRIGVIQASSQRDKNELLYRCTCDAVRKNGRDDTVINYGIYADSGEVYSYIDAALNISLLLSSGTADMIVTGCSSGQGMMLACNSLPSVICGYVPTPQDAFLFGRINDGNAVSVPLGLNFGWLGEINLLCTLDKLFEGEFGCGYPPEDADRKRRDTEHLKRLNADGKLPVCEAFARYDIDLLKSALRWESVRKDIFENAKNRDVIGIYDAVN
ncbi:MAG: RpiB/LacA/LacB family sugar-phosphate isomerase [Oscillospiraceae bacterium]|nr:RpiB/LacA/LacB family sugar-phosphate isomerase [Oscillospiraceae bacterium]